MLQNRELWICEKKTHTPEHDGATGYEYFTPIRLYDSSEVFDKIINWAVARNLVEGATPAAQFEKLAEEFGELGRALIEDDQAKFEDAVGDMVVVLTILAAQRDTNIEKCIAGAYDEIKDRTGKMVDGKFVKDAK